MIYRIIYIGNKDLTPCHILWKDIVENFIMIIAVMNEHYVLGLRVEMSNE